LFEVCQAVLEEGLVGFIDVSCLRDVLARSTPRDWVHRKAYMGAESYRLREQEEHAAMGQVAAVGGDAFPGRELPAEGGSAVSVEREGDVVLIRFNASEVKDISCARQASKELKDLAIAVGGNMLLSLGNVTFLSSVGVAALVSFHRALRTVGGQLKVCEMRPTIRGLFSASGLEEVLEVYDTKAGAMWSFRSAKQ